MALDDIGAKITAAMEERNKKREKERQAEAKRRREAAEKVDPHEDMTAPNLAAAVTKHYETTEADPTSKEGDAS
jgi:hypothetical protein